MLVLCLSLPRVLSGEYNAGSMARTARDLILLDSIVRKPNCTTDAKGAIETPVSCDVDVDLSFNLSGVRLGLPSTLGWNNGISSEVNSISVYFLPYIL